MADVNLPSINELSQLSSLPVGLNQLAGRNIDLGTQFANQNLAQGDQTLQQQTLNNLFQQANDPNRLKSNAASADTATSEAILKGLDAQQRQTLAPEELAAKRQKFVTGLADDKLQAFMSEAQASMMSDDPSVADKAKDAYMRSSKEISARAKAGDDMAKQAAELTSRESIAAGNNAAQLGSAQIMANGRIQVAGMHAQVAQDADSDLATAKNDASFVNKAEAWANKLNGLGTAEGQAAGQYYQQLAERRKAEMMQRAVATTNMRNANTPDIGKIGSGAIPTVGNQMPGLPPMPQRPAFLPQVGAPRTVSTMGNGAGDPPPGSGLPQGGPADNPVEGLRRTAKDLQDAMAAKSSLPANQQGALDAHIQSLRSDLVNYQRMAQSAPQQAAPVAPTAPVATPQSQQQAAPVPAAPKPQLTPNGRVVIYKDGKGFSVPPEQAQQALSQGYSLTK